MENPKTFHYLNQSNCYEIDGLDESKEYAATKRAMDVVGISFEEQVILGSVIFKAQFSLRLLLPK